MHEVPRHIHRLAPSCDGCLMQGIGFKDFLVVPLTTGMTSSGVLPNALVSSKCMQCLGNKETKGGALC
eukprot:1160680-Pelagomonas_calceolata.AAC.12